MRRGMLMLVLGAALGCQERVVSVCKPRAVSVYAKEGGFWRVSCRESSLRVAFAICEEAKPNMLTKEARWGHIAFEQKRPVSFEECLANRVKLVETCPGEAGGDYELVFPGFHTAPEELTSR